MQRATKVFIIQNKWEKAVVDAENRIGCFSEDRFWAIHRTQYRIFVLSGSEEIDKALLADYEAVPLKQPDGYRIVLSEPSQIHHGDKSLTAFLVS
jgi:hypothetical protein